MFRYTAAQSTSCFLKLTDLYRNFLLNELFTRVLGCAINYHGLKHCSKSTVQRKDFLANWPNTWAVIVRSQVISLMIFIRWFCYFLIYLIRHGVLLLNWATLLILRRCFQSCWPIFANWSPSKVRKKTWKGLSNLGLPLYNLCTPPLPFSDFSWGEGGSVHRLAPPNPGPSELTRRKLKCYEKYRDMVQSRVLFISLFFVMSTTAVH